MSSYQVDSGTVVRIRTTVEVPPASLEKSAGHVNVVMSEVKHQHFQTLEYVRLCVHSKLYQLTYQCICPSKEKTTLCIK